LFAIGSSFYLFKQDYSHFELIFVRINLIKREDKGEPYYSDIPNFAQRHKGIRNDQELSVKLRTMLHLQLF